MVAESTFGDEQMARALNAILYRVDETLKQTAESFPYVADPETGEWTTVDDGNWAAGHWVGLLWLACEHADDESNQQRFREAAYDHIDSMTTQPLDNIFMAMGLYYAGFRGYDVTGDRSLFGLGLTAADEMLELYSESARQIPTGDYSVATPGSDVKENQTSRKYPLSTRKTAVDVIYTALPVLWRAYDETNRTAFRDVAVSHADRHLDWHVRRDGSTIQLTVFDSETGEIKTQYNSLAIDDSTCWARGEGWNIAGLARAFHETGAERYLNTLERSVDYYVQNTPDDLVPYWDFDAPDAPDTPRDTSAAALTAYGLTRLDPKGEPRVASLQSLGVQILESIVSKYIVVDETNERRGMVLHGCFNKPAGYATDNELLWTDYYVAYALHKLLRY